MTTQEENKNTMTKLEWGVLFSFLLSSASVIFSAGVVWTTLQQHERDIVMLKANDESRVDRLARIETKLDIILADRSRK